MKRLNDDIADDLGERFANRRPMTGGEVLDAYGDWQRARREESRLTREVAKKDATIKALADALGRHVGTMVDGEYVAPPDVIAALRLAGRLP